MAKGHFYGQKCEARRDLTRVLEAERGVVFSTSPQMRRPYFTGFKLLLEHLGEEDEIITELFSSCGISQTSF